MKTDKNEFHQSIAGSDYRIAAALSTLREHNRGLNTLCEFKRMARGMASGLDSAGQAALKVLFEEWLSGRRTFLDSIPDVVLPPKALRPPPRTATKDGRIKSSACP